MIAVSPARSGYDDYDYISEWSSSFEGVRSETDYYATDGAKKEVNTNAPLYEGLEPDFRIDDDKEQWNSYESVFVLDFDEDGNLSVDVKKDGTVSADTLIKSLLQADRYNDNNSYPNVTAVFQFCIQRPTPPLNILVLSG
jgi:hypothetical protein